MKTRSGATEVQIVETKHGRVIVEHLGLAHTDAELAALMRAGRVRSGLADRAQLFGALPSDLNGGVPVVETVGGATASIAGDYV